MRNFSIKQKLAVELVTGRTGEADHIQPYSKGGKTVVENCQLIDSATNKRKSAFVFTPRKWQIDFFDCFDNRKKDRPFMMIAIPGSGKTMAAIEVARKWLAAGADRRLIVVVPSDNLRNQWQSEALNFGIELQTKEFKTNFKHGFQGGVSTYHSVGNNPDIYRKLCSVAPTMVIFDEIHHCGEDSHFGNGIKEGFCLAKEVLCMSGTPWKTDGVPIPFVHYNREGFAVADYHYNYPDALTDEVVRYLVFDYAKGIITNDLTGNKLELSEDISENEASTRLKILLDPEGEYVRKQIEDSHRKLLECRKQVPDAGAMAICIDQIHAVKVARTIKSVTGCDPSIVVSDNQIENDSINSFRKSKKEWLVSVRKISEGTDIKRLQVLSYLTNITSELFFRQAIGRVSRVRGMEDYEGYVYLPADPRLIRCAQNIENAQVVALKSQIKRDIDLVDTDDDDGDGGGGCGGDLFSTWTTEHNGTGNILIGAVQVPVAEARKIERIAEAVGISMQKVREVLLLSGSANESQPSHQTKEIGLEEKCDKLRKKCQSAAFRLSKMLGVDVKEVHKDFNKNFKRQAEMSLAELEDKYKHIIKEMQKCSMR